MKKLSIIVIGTIFLACTGPESEGENSEPIVSADTVTVDTITVDSSEFEEPYIIDSLEQSIIDAGLVNIQDSIPGILVDLKYSTLDNFMEEDVYGHMSRAYLQPEVAASLKKSQESLKERDSSLTLLVFDAVRPRSVQQIMWDIVDLPVWEKGKFVSNPANGSVHNYGCAVDLTIAQNDGTPLDMGAGYDDPAKIAYPRHEQAYLDSGMLSTDQIANRELLRAVMRDGGFWGIGTEWWHFNRYSRAKAKTMYKILE